MAKDSMIVAQASEQPPKTNASTATSGSMPGKMKGGKMPHEVMSDKMAKGLGC